MVPVDNIDIYLIFGRFERSLDLLDFFLGMW